MNIENFELIYKDNRVKIKDKSKVKARLSEIVGNENVSDNEIDILAYNKDSTLLTLNWTLEGKIAALPD